MLSQTSLLELHFIVMLKSNYEEQSESITKRLCFPDKSSFFVHAYNVDEQIHYLKNRS